MRFTLKVESLKNGGRFFLLRGVFAIKKTVFQSYRIPFSEKN
jgi:hypothetical protein